ncbi:unnamed protein product [Prorocentrum cordatum]|uniref:Reverse transcriptase Ty1/copia-type domain-containing protein n=1 Tax=Prorocentrum cordatum TaxID=2364126 RepID=A0ABN9VRB3_9DINO|nr:unnamed protein product [Polarella glacialis]
MAEERAQALEQQMMASAEELHNRQQRENDLTAEVQRLGRAAEARPRVEGLVLQPRAESLVDTRTLGKPDVCAGEEHKWNDWKVIFKAYCGVVNADLLAGMRLAESADEAPVQIDDFIEENMRQASQQLYYILLLLCRQHPLTTILNAGENEGFQAWRKLVEYYEPRARSRIAGQLLNLLNFSFTGDVEDRLALFERELLRYEQRSGEAIAASMRIGIVFRQLEEGPLRQRLLLNATKLVEWQDFRREVADVRRAQSAIAPAPVPMDLSAMGQTLARINASQSTSTTVPSAASSISTAATTMLSPATAMSGASSRQVAALYLNDADEQVSYPFANLHSLIIHDPGPDKADVVDSATGAALVLNMIHGNSDAEEVELNGILRVGIDSCSAASVLPRGSCTDYPVHEGGQAISYKTASGHYVNDEGERLLVGAMPGASQARAAKFRVADVSKPLLSVAEMVDFGHRLVFDSEGGQDISYAYHKTSGDVVKFCRRNNVYEMGMHVDPYVPEACPVEAAGREPPEGEAGQSGAAREEVAEGPPARPARRPAAPTAAERAAHEVLHEPYRAWCRECVSGRGLSAGHRAKDRQGSALAVVGIDYGYLGEREDATPLLIGKDSKQRWFHASRFVFRSGGEAPLVALKTRIGAKLKQEYGIETVPEESAVGDSQGNGLAEHAVREVKAKARAARAQVGDLHGVSIGVEHPATPWMVEFAAMSINLGRRGADGRTAWELRHGRPFNKDLACFSGKVLYLPGGKRKAGIEDKLLAGLYLGPTLRTGEVYIGTELGALRARAFKRLTVEQRADEDLLNSLVGKPRAPVPTDMAADEVPVAIEIRAPAPAPVAPVGAPLAPIPEAEDLPPWAPRQEDVEIAKYGISPGCHGCAAILNGARAQAHSAERRARIEQAMQDDEEAKQRLEDARERKRHRTDVAGPVYQEGGSSGSGGPAPAQQAPPAPEAAAAADVAIAPAPHDPGDDNMQEEIGALLLSLGYSGRKADVMEVFCPNRLVGFAPLFGLVRGGSFALRVGWGLTDRRQQRQCRELIEHYEVYLLLGSPRCAPFSMLKYLNEDSEKQREAYAVGHEHLRFAMELHALQVKHDRTFLHEHPWSADSWGLDIVKDVMALPGVEVGRGDQCVFGLVVADAHGDRLAKKPTGWMSDNKEVLDEVCKRCPNDTGIGSNHEHSTFVGRNMRVAERYPVKLLRAILRGLRRHLGNKKVLALSALDAGPNVGDEEISLKGFVGRWRDTLRTERLEMDFMAQLGVWVYAREGGCQRELGRRPLSVRWVDIDKGDTDRPDYRSRLVAQETKAQSTIARDDIGVVFAATPPLECLRLICSCSMAMSSDPSEGRVLRFLDISRAHPHCEIKRTVYIKLPEEDPMMQEIGTRGLLRMALYGARDAGQNFELTIAEAVIGAGCDQSAFSPCAYCHKDLQVSFFHHGDDFVLEGSRGGTESIRVALKTKFILKDRGVLGPAPTDAKEITCLNRVVRWRDRWSQGGEAIEYEADPRHAQILHAQLGMDPRTTKSLSTPGLSQKLTPEVERELNEHEAAEYRSVRMRLGYLALDRPEVQFTAKECARGMQMPTERHFRLLKRAGRFLIGAPRAIWKWGRQRAPTAMDIYSDTDWAGCPITRRSTSSVVTKYGQHLIVTASTTQIPISMSSGEAEFYGCVRAASRAIGMQSLCHGLGREASLRIWSDSAAALGIMQRRGCGKVRRLETPTLRVQKALKDGRFQLAKVPGKSNPADLGAKFLDQAAMLRGLKTMNVELSDALLSSALQAKVAAVLACTSPLPRPWLWPSAAPTAEYWLVWLGASAALQCAAVCLAAEAATQGLHYRRRLVLLWAHGALAAASLGPLACGAARGLPLSAAGPRTVATAAVLFTAWACANGSGAIFGPRGYPAPVKWYLTRHFGSPAHGKALLIKYHRTVGALAYALTTLSAVLLLLSGAGAAAPAGLRAAACCALALAAAAALGPSALRRRFGLPQVHLARGGSGVPRLEVVL